MADRYLSRSAWGARTDLPRLGHPVEPSVRTEIHVHHTAAIDGNDSTPNRWSESEAIAYMRLLQTVRAQDLGADIPYSEVYFVLENLDVLILEGRGVWRTGAHTKGHNTAGLGWAAAGNFDTNDQDAIRAAVASIDNRLRWLRDTSHQFPNLTSSKPPNGRAVWGHRDTRSTACPGRWLYAALDAVDRAPVPTPEPAPVGTHALVGEPDCTVAQMQRWAEAKGGTDRYVALAAVVHDEATAIGIIPSLVFALMGHETGMGRFGGVVEPTFNNWGGLKTALGGSNTDPAAHARFPDDRTGVRAVVQHVALYGGVRLPAGEIVDPRWDISRLGTAPALPSPGWAWSSDPDAQARKITGSADEMRRT